MEKEKDIVFKGKYMKLEDIKIGDTYKIDCAELKRLGFSTYSKDEDRIVCRGLIKQWNYEGLTTDWFVYFKDGSNKDSRLVPVQYVKEISKHIFYATKSIELTPKQQTTLVFNPEQFQIIENNNEINEIIGCKCSTQDLMISGCVCGYIEKERLQKKS